MLRVSDSRESGDFKLFMASSIELLMAIDVTSYTRCESLRSKIRYAERICWCYVCCKVNKSDGILEVASG